MNTINGIPFLWDIEEDNRLFRQIDPFLRNTNTTNFGGLSTNKRFDEITFEKKIGEEFKCLPCQDSFYKGVLNFNLLISDLRERQRFDNDFFYYQKYT